MKKHIGGQTQINNNRQAHWQIRRKSLGLCSESPILLISAFTLLFCLMSKAPFSEGMPTHWMPKNFTVTLVQIIDSKNKAKRSIQEVIETEEDRKPLVLVNGNNKILIVGQSPNRISGERTDPQKYGSVNILRLANVNSSIESIVRSDRHFYDNVDDEDNDSFKKSRSVLIRGMLSNNFVCMTPHGNIYGGVMIISLAIRQLPNDCVWKLQMEHGELYFYHEVNSRRRYLTIENTQVFSSNRRNANTNFRYFFRYDQSTTQQKHQRQLNHVLSDRINIAGEQYNLVAKHSSLLEWLQQYMKPQCKAERQVLLLEVQADDLYMTRILEKIHQVKARYERALTACHCLTSEQVGQMSRTFHRYLFLQKNSIPHLNLVMKLRKEQESEPCGRRYDMASGVKSRICRRKRKHRRQVEQKALLKLHGSNLLANAELYQRGLKLQNACYQQLNPVWQWFKRNPTKSMAPQVQRLRSMRKKIIESLFPIYLQKHGASASVTNSSSVSLSYIIKKTLDIALPKPAQLHKALLRRSLIRKFQLRERHEDFLVWDKYLYHLKFEQLRVKLNHTRQASDPRTSNLKFHQCFPRATIEKMKNICFKASMFFSV